MNIEVTLAELGYQPEIVELPGYRFAGIRTGRYIKTHGLQALARGSSTKFLHILDDYSLYASYSPTLYALVPLEEHVSGVTGAAIYYTDNKSHGYSLDQLTFVTMDQVKL